MRALILILLSGFVLNSQTIRINEVVSSNSIFFDEDGDTPDWIELYNYGNQSVNMGNWAISDDENNLTKWIFPEITIPANNYLLLWASNKNRSQTTYSRTLINQGDSYNYIIPSAEPSSNWTYLNFNDSDWLNGASGFGYSDNDDNTIVPNGTLSVYIRKTFDIGNIEDITSLILDIDYDDAFVAYINGVEVARANITGVPPPYNSENVYTDHEAQIYAGGLPDRFLMSDYTSILVEGENVLAIQAHNVSPTSSDLTIIPFLTAIYASPNYSGIDPPEILNLNDNNKFHTNFKISSNSETITLSSNSGTVIDQMIIEGLPPNTSIGISNFSNTKVSYQETTPGYQNATDEFIGTVPNEVIFSEIGGLKSQNFYLSLSGNETFQNIHYTTDGSEPSLLSPIYSGSILITRNTSVRARIYQQNYLPSKTVTESYIFGASHDIDLMLISVNPDDFFDEDTGIYTYGPEGTYEAWDPHFGANFWEDWERPIHISFHETNSDEPVSFNGGVKIFGGWSRGQNGQRSLSFFARGQYGDSKFKHSFFDHLLYNDFQAFVLRNSGQDWLKSSMKDIMITSLMRGTELDFQEHNPVATYINGEYWGMYNMREKINEHMLASKHNLDADEITLLTNNGEIIEGNNEEYNQLIDYINNYDLSNDSNFGYIRERIDLKQYALYKAYNIFINNTDWPGNNIKFWKHPNTKWRWIMYDTDFGFGPFWNISNYWENTLSFALNPNGPDWPNPPWSTLLFRKLITNIGFRNQFINRYADELNTRLLPDNVLNHIDSIYSTIEPEIEAHYNRWKDDPSTEGNISNIGSHVNYYIQKMKDFGVNRHPLVKEHIKQQFNLPDFHPITITNQDTSQGFVKMNDNFRIQEDYWTGDYFETVPIELTAIPEFGYTFSHWSGDLYTTNETIQISLVNDFEITPNFIAKQTTLPPVINEINYRSSDDFNPDDWIELYNPNSSSIEISNWEIKDDDDTHIFVIPQGTQIDANGYLIFVKDESDFINVFPNIDYIGELGFGLGKSDSVRLFDSNGTLQDEVIYQSVSPWPSCAESTGNTLELNDPNLDNSLPENWDCLNINGSPKDLNNNNLSYEEFGSDAIEVYPNPAIYTLYIGNGKDYFDLEVYNVQGQEVSSIKTTNLLDVSSFKKGVYFLKIKTKNNTIVKRIVKY